MKKLLTLLVTAILAVTCCLGLTACGDSTKPYEGIKKVNYEDMKVGLICLHGDSSTYDKNFIDAFKAACAAKGISEDRYFIKTDIDESNEAYDAAVELVGKGCNLIFADSFGHEEFILKAAKEYPDVQFCHATGVTASATQRGNFHNAFANIYEGRYLAGYAAGLKLLTMTDKAVSNNFKLGYVGAWPFAEVKSGYTSWYLGVKAALESTEYTATMEVSFTNSWYAPTDEKAAAETLISRGAVLVSQHADSMGAPEACETAKVPNVSYNGSTESECPDTFIVSSRINWVPYYEYCMDCLNNQEEIVYDYTNGFGETWFDGSVCLTALGVNAMASVENAEASINTVLAELKAKTRFVFDCSKFTVNGAALTAADSNMIKTDAATSIVYFAESSTICAPSFAYNIDGITILS